MTAPLLDLEYYRAHPPRCLSALRAVPVAVPAVALDGHAEGALDVAFVLRCRCGGGSFVATGWVNAQEEIGPPVSVQCQACQAEYEVFDPTCDGHDAVLRSHDPAESDLDEDAYPDDYPEPHPPYEILVRLEYTDVRDDERLQGRECDAFTWISILARTEEGQLHILCDWECA